MAYTYDPIFAADPSNAANVAASASITIFDPNDPSKAPVTITDVTGSPLPNPITVNAKGFGPAFQHATLDRVGWFGAGFTNYFTAYEGMKDEAVAARQAAESAANEAAATAADRVTAAAVNGAGKLVLTKASGATVDAGSVVGPAGPKGDKGNDGSNVVPTQAAIQSEVTTPGTPTDAALKSTYAPASGSSSYAPTNGGDTTNLRALALNKPTFDGSFTFSKISATQDGLIAVKDLTVTGGFGGQVGQGGPISYFKAIGIAGHHSGAGNYDHFWGSLYHDGTREAGMFIGDITGRRGGNVYGAHFLVKSQTTAPPFMVGASFEIVPLVARGTTSTNTVGTAIPASTTITSVTLGTAVQLTDGTNIAFTAADSSKVVAYVNGSMGASSTTVPVTPFTTASPISSGSSVTVGVASAYFGTVVRNSGNQTAGAAIQIEAPEYTGDKATVPPFLYGLNLDASASSAQSTGINFGGSWATGINMNGTTIVQAGSIAGVGSSPNRDVRLVDNLLLDNSRYIKMKNAAGTAKGVMRVGPTDNLRFIAPGASNEFQFYDTTEATLLARITSAGRADFSTAGVTTKYTSGAAQPAYLTNGQVEVWHDTGSGNDYLVVNVNGVSKKVALA